jgi:hypothetical protein
LADLNSTRELTARAQKQEKTEATAAKSVHNGLVPRQR